MTYSEELQTIRQASATFRTVTATYRAGTIGDAEYLAARQTYQDAEKRFDAAYAKAQHAADFTWTKDGEFYSVYPESEQATVMVRAMITAMGSNKLTAGEFAEFKRQARRAGYSVRKAVQSGMNAEELAGELG